ncbi:glycosyltransferase family 39 protein [Rhodoferax sp.]|uniref:ArnT family glycosyltransferase n=1 Tax=Rhodoferax sp. TaxID=50421 RepID=UPI001EB18616|nr:glycosyltransferase family 39 protein [Rhodoferax sp.]MBT9506406.1 glycosyltransferase family 39 protein [Rhodoferax sp.]
MNTSLTEQKKSWLILAGLWLVLLTLAVLRPLAVPDEGRYGEIGRWMLESGDWLTPRLNGIPFFHKPPYLYWLEAMSVATLGTHELALRLIPALHVGLMLVALYVSARIISTEQIARRAAMMLGTSLTFLIGGQYVNHDMLVASWIGVAIWCFAFAFMAGDRPHATLARVGFIACAMGMLSKGLIGIALPGLVIFIWLLWTRQFKKVLYLPWLSGLTLFALIALPWFVIAQQKYPQLFDYMFINQHFKRYTATSYNNPQPWWFYLLTLVLLMFPWVFFALNQVRRSAHRALGAALPMSRAWWSLCWIWVVAIMVFFSIPNSKLVGYVLPVMPALALLSALGWERTLGHRSFSGKLFAGLCVLNLGIALTLVLKVGDVTRTGRAQDVAQALACAARPSDTVYVAGAFPYDLPFYAQTSKPMVVLGEWAAWRKAVGDGWQRELFEGADFDAHAARVLQSPSELAKAGAVPGNWFVTQRGNPVAEGVTGWKLFYEGAGWVLYQSVTTSAAEGPKSAEHKGLPGCKNQRHE